MSTKYTTSESNASRPARKRGACLNCKHRKIRCDGNKPTCSQCSQSSGAFKDCEYPGQGPTPSQVLDIRISEAKARISELERLGKMHHNGTNSYHFSSRDSSPSTISRRSRSRSSSSSSYSGKSSASSITSIAEPSFEVRQLLLNAFFSNTQRCGFFLDAECFLDKFMRPFPIEHHGRPTPSLLYAVYLWAVYVSPALDITHGLDEYTLLGHTRNSLSKDLAGSHPSKIDHVMQAEILLSYYFLEHGRVLQGNYHANSALALSLSSGFHDLRIQQIPETSHSLVY